MGNVIDAAAPQHLKALANANEVRIARAAVKRNVANGNVTAAEVIETRPWQTETMSISELLMCQRRWGRTRCRRLLFSVQVPENKHLGTLTERQRGTLLAALEGGQPGGRAEVPSSAVRSPL